MLAEQPRTALKGEPFQGLPVAGTKFALESAKALTIALYSRLASPDGKVASACGANGPCHRPDSYPHVTPAWPDQSVARDQPSSFGLPAIATCATAGDYDWQASEPLTQCILRSIGYVIFAFLPVCSTRKTGLPRTSTACDSSVTEMPSCFTCA